MTQLNTLFEDLLRGARSVGDLEVWAESMRHLYVRPDLQKLHETDFAETNGLIDAYSDWQIREVELIRLLQRAHRVADETEECAPERALKALKAAEVLSSIHPNVMSQAVVRFRTGYLLWRLQRFKEAIPHLAAAEMLLRQLDGETGRELTSLSYLLTCLREGKNFDEAIEAADRLLDRSRALGVAACQALALRDRGMARSELGRPGALEDLRAALEARKNLSEEEAAEYSVPDVGGFLEDFGVIARKQGQYELATATFLELAELQRIRNEPALEARAISDVGYTYHSSGEDGRAAHYLATAADLADQAGAHADARRWRMQAAIFSGERASIEVDFYAESLAAAIKDRRTAYEFAALVEFLVSRDRFEDALALAGRVLDWARSDKDSSLQIAALNAVGICYARLEAFDKAIPSFQAAIRLADGLGDAAGSLNIRHGLATAFIMAGKNSLAGDVLWSALALGERLLDSSPSSEVRQQVAARVLAIHEVFASLLAQTGNHAIWIDTTEMARTCNLRGWMKAAGAIPVAPDGVELRRLLDELRASEIELEVRHLSLDVTHQDIQAVRMKRDRLRAELDEGFTARGRPPVTWSSGAESLIPDVRGHIATGVAAGDAALFLFTVSEGVCAAVIRADSGGVGIRGTFVRWDRDERRAALAPWLCMGDAAQSSGSALSPELFETAMPRVRKRLFEEIGPLFDARSVRNLLVVPHGELALLPYWELFELVRGSGSLCITPSLEVHLLSTRLAQNIRGRTVVVPDVTGSLRHARWEVEIVGSAFGGAERCSTTASIRQFAPEATVIHVAAHGVFNFENPYLGGFIVGDPIGGSDQATGPFTQYVASPRRFAARPAPDAWMLLTVAECMAGLSLARCRVAVLSTCESGVPRLHGGGELMGLPTGLLLAGAQSVVASLWRVHDAAAALLTYYFYDVWAGARGTVEGVACALAEARRRLRVTTAEEAGSLLRHGRDLPPGKHPFENRFFCDAFQCFGSY